MRDLAKLWSCELMMT